LARRIIGVETEYGILGAEPEDVVAACLEAESEQGRCPGVRWDYSGEYPLRDARGFEVDRSAVDPSMLTDVPGAASVEAPPPQTGRTGSGGGTPDTLRRLDNIIGQIADHCARHRYQEILLIDAGDICEGFDNTVSQEQTNDLDLTTQIRTAQAVMAKALKALAGHAPDVSYIAVPSNHCQLRRGTGRSQRVGKPSNDWGLLIQDNIRMTVEGRPGYEHGKFRAPAEQEETLTLNTLGGTHHAVIAEADNAEQRRRRLSFYERSGFRDTGYAVQDSTGEDWTPARGGMIRPRRWAAGPRPSKPRASGDDPRQGALPGPDPE